MAGRLSRAGSVSSEEDESPQGVFRYTPVCMGERTIPMICQDIQSQLNRYLDGELPAEERSRVEQHLSVCDDCRGMLEDLRTLSAALAKVPAPLDVPSGFAERVMAHAAQRTEPPTTIMRQWYSFSPLMRIAAAAMLVLGIALGALMARSLSGDAPRVSGVATADPNNIYGIDYLSEAPGGSLADTYLTLASADN